MFFSFGKRDRQQPAEAFPEAWLSILRDNVLLYQTLSEAEQARLREAVAVLVAGKSWEGCASFAITDEVKVTIAGQAALLLLGHDGYHFDELKTILVYPGRFLIAYEDEFGHDEVGMMALGQAAADGPVALSWWHARWGGRRLGPVNVVVHEFAHKLAELGDPLMARPPLLGASLRRRWDRVMPAACEQLAEDGDYGRPTLLDPYGGESLTEFFAVASEAFFLRPVELSRRHPDVYDLLAACYRQDPAQRTVPPEVAATARAADEEYDRQAVNECTAALRHRPDYLDAYRERADHRLALGDVDGALADWAAVLARVKGEERADALYSRGGVLAEADRLDEALADYSEAIRLCPDFALAYTDRGATLAERGERKAALADFNEAIRLDSRDDTALFERARLYREAGKPERALRDLDRAARLCPYRVDVLCERARAHLAMKDFRKALADADAALRLEPEDAEALAVRAEALEGLGRAGPSGKK